MYYCYTTSAHHIIDRHHAMNGGGACGHLFPLNLKYHLHVFICYLAAMARTCSLYSIQKLLSLAPPPFENVLPPPR